MHGQLNDAPEGATSQASCAPSQKYTYLAKILGWASKPLPVASKALTLAPELCYLLPPNTPGGPGRRIHNAAGVSRSANTWDEFGCHWKVNLQFLLSSSIPYRLTGPALFISPYQANFRTLDDVEFLTEEMNYQNGPFFFVQCNTYGLPPAVV